MKNLIPTPICFHDDLDYVLHRPRVPTEEEIKNHTGDRFDLSGLTTPVFDAEDHRDEPINFDLSEPFENLSIYGSFASGNPTYATTVYFGVNDYGTHEYSFSDHYAVKIRSKKNCDQEDMRREASLSLSHANMTPIISAGEISGDRLYGVMEFVNGISVQQALKLLTSYALDVNVKSLPRRKRRDSCGIKAIPYARSPVEKITPTHNSIRHIEKVIKRMLTPDQRTLLRGQFR